MSHEPAPRTPWLRRHILVALLKKEVHRHLANRGGIALVLLLIVASLLLSLTGNRGEEASAVSFSSGVKRCYIDYWERDDWVEHLIDNVPASLDDSIRFRNAPKDARTTEDGTLIYPQNAGAIQIRPNPDGDGPRHLVWVWHPGSDGSSMAAHEAWFWKETRRYALNRSAAELKKLDPAVAQTAAMGDIAERRSELKGGLDPRSGIATSLVMFGLFFVCVYLLPSLSCEERERGVLLAQALSPARPREILAARFLFYPVLGLVLAAVLAGTYNPSVLLKPFFWLAMVAAVCGSMGIGLTIASIARTQRAASLGAMCYLLGVSVILFICGQNGIPFLSNLALEYHCPRIIHAVLGDAVLWYHWLHLAAAAFLACVWAVVATVLFRRVGWQT